MAQENAEKDLRSMLQRIRDVAKNIQITPPPGQTIDEYETTLVNEELRVATENYSAMLHDMNALIRKQQADIETLKTELHEERAVTNKLEKKLLEYNMYHPSAPINRRMFSLYVHTVHNREATNEEWEEFVETFSYNMSFTNAIYNWIDSHINEIKLTVIPLPMSPSDEPQ